MINTKKLILGTVQLGMQYGINNNIGKPKIQEAFRILNLAKDSGISMLDTAESYGDAIKIIGKYHSNETYRFDIISKFKFIPGIDLKKNVEETIKATHTDYLFAYLLHDAHFLSENSVKESFVYLKSIGLIKNSGVSIYTNHQFEKAISTDCIDIIQIPYNILDNENQRGKLIRQAKLKGKQIHVRSVFLQGLFFMPEDKLPKKLYPLKKYLLKINQLCKKFNVSKESAALNYSVNNNLIDGVLTGVDSSFQLLKNIEATSQKNPAEVTSLINKIIVKEIELLNPVNWN